MALSSDSNLFEKLNPEDLMNTFLGLEQRQQILVVIGGLFIILILLVLPISCVSSKLGDLEKDYKKVKKGQKELMTTIGEYQASKAALISLQKSLSSEGGSLTTVMENIAKEAGLDQNIKRLKPITLPSSDYYDEEGVDLIIAKVSLADLIKFIHLVESYDKTTLRIKKMQVKSDFKKRSELTATLEISRMTLREEGEGA